MTPRHLAFALALVPGIALAQTTQSPDPDAPTVPPSFGAPGERAAPESTQPPHDQTAPQATEGGDPASGAGIAAPDQPGPNARRPATGEGGHETPGHGGVMQGMNRGGMMQMHHQDGTSPEQGMEGMERMHEMMMRHHGRNAAGANIDVAAGDRRLRISCGDTPIAECVEGVAPLLDLLR